MPRGVLSDEDRERLDDHFWAIVGRACVRNRCWRGEVLNLSRKSHGVARISTARREITDEMRRTAFTYYESGQCQITLVENPGAPYAIPLNAKPVSFPLLARMIGVDHSTLVPAQQRTARDKPPAAVEN